MSISGKAYIAGIYEHPTRKADDKSLAQLHAESAKGALADAGLGLGDIDGYFCAGDAPGVLSMANYLGLAPRHIDSTDCGGSSYIVHVGHAAEAIAAGKCRVALITLAGKPRTDPNFAAAMRAQNAASPEYPFEHPYRAHHRGACTRWRRCGTCTSSAPRRRARLGQGRGVASRAMERARDAARGGDGRGRARLADDRRSAAPARLLRHQRRRRRDRRDIARDREEPHAAARQNPRRGRGAEAPVGGTIDLSFSAARWSGAAAFAEAGVTPADMKYASIYDSFTITVVMQLEDLGFCEKGKGGRFVADGNLISGVGRLPFNTDGGGLCNNHPANRGGLTKVLEAVRQLRGEAHPRCRCRIATSPSPAASAARSARATPAPPSSWSGSERWRDERENPGTRGPIPRRVPYWEAASRGVLLLKRCRACGKAHHFPRALCPFCMSGETDWVAASGEGEIYSFSVMRREKPPYALAYVTLAEGVRVMTNIVECDFDALRIGMRVTLAFQPSENGSPVADVPARLKKEKPRRSGALCHHEARIRERWRRC